MGNEEDINYESESTIAGSNTSFELESGKSTESMPFVQGSSSQQTSLCTSTSRKEHGNEFELIDLSAMNQDEKGIQFVQNFSSGATQHEERKVVLTESESEKVESLV